MSKKALFERFPYLESTDLVLKRWSLRIATIYLKYYQTRNCFNIGLVTHGEPLMP
jgi:hypothetical protein